MHNSLSQLIGGAGILALALSALPSQAAIINLAKYEFGTSGTTLTSTDTDTLSTTSNLMDGPGVTSVESTIANHSGGRYILGTYLTSTSESNAVTNNDYVFFRITPNAGYQLDLDSMTFAAGIKSSTGSPNKWFVRSSVDSFASTIASGTITKVTGTTAGNFNVFTINLSAPAFDHLTSTTEMRLYFWNGVSNDINTLVRYDEVTLKGQTLTLPEPASMGLLGLGALALLRRRK